jgi:hypothetical protein
VVLLFTATQFGSGAAVLLETTSKPSTIAWDLTFSVPENKIASKKNPPIEKRSNQVSFAKLLFKLFIKFLFLERSNSRARWSGTLLEIFEPVTT